jgi:hypothetical protein
MPELKFKSRKNGGRPLNSSLAFQIGHISFSSGTATLALLLGLAVVFPGHERPFSTLMCLCHTYSMFVMKLSELGTA